MAYSLCKFRNLGSEADIARMSYSKFLYFFELLKEELEKKQSGSTGGNLRPTA